MAYFIGLLFFTLSCLACVQCLPPRHDHADPNDYKLALSFNTTTNYFNGTDPQHPFASSLLRVTVYSDKPKSLSVAAGAMQDKITALPTISKLELPSSQENSSEGEGKGFTLVYIVNATVALETGPTRPSGILGTLQYNLWKAT